MVFYLASHVPLLPYSSKNIKNSYNFYTYVLKYYLDFIVVVLYLLDKLETRNKKLETRNDKLEMSNDHLSI